jgi:serine/threonine-protein kinase
MEEVLTHLREELAGRYVVEQELGRGGMALVYRAQDLKHERTVALKVLRPDLGMSSASERFVREIRTAAQLRHPHILPLYDSGTAGGHPFYVMPYVEGETLRERLEREGCLPLEDAVRIGREVADALQFAHDRGIVHRDIKPENIFLSAGHAAVADFGIARAADVAGLKLTDTGLALGTPTYMSPEQATADPKVDGRADQYALGCVVYEMLSGGPPFSGSTSQMVMARHTADAVPPISTVRSVPAALEAAVVKALAKVPADRWPTVRAFADALEPSARATSDRPVGAGARRRIVPWLAGAAAVLVVGVVAWPRWFGDAARASKHAAPDVLRSIAVLPFTYSGDTAFAPLAEGMSEGLTTGLVRVEGLAFPVGGFARARELRDQLGDPKQIGRKLGVNTIVTGTVEILGKRIRITTQLVNVVDGALVWQQRFYGDLGDGETADLFSLQDNMAEQIVAALRPELTPAKRAVAAQGIRTRNLEALRLLAESKRAPHNTIEGNARAIDLARQAIRLDSTFADAWLTVAERLREQYGLADQSSADVALAWRSGYRQGDLPG